MRTTFSSTASQNLSHSHLSKTVAQTAAAATPTASDLELNNSAAIFTAGTLAGFHQITIDIGGKEQTLNVNSKLTAAELVAAQQVLSGGKQEITINAKGVATGGFFDLNATTLSALDSATGGSINSLYVSHGVLAIDTLANLSLSGSLVNMGTIDLGAASGSKGQTLDSISATNITNSAGAVIASASGVNGVSGVTGTGVALNATSTFSNSGKVTSAGDLNISAPTINNSCLLSATAGNVNLTGVGGNLTVNGAGGTVQALHGNINIDTASGNGNIVAGGGNWLSQQLNINAGTGTNDVSVEQVSGTVNVTAGCSHVTADTADLKLGVNNISGDPTYFNAGGNITISNDISTTGTADLAVLASGNIIGNGGTINTGGGTLTLIAGANFAAATPSGTGSVATPPGDSTTAVVLQNNGSVAGNGSKTGGFIDLSGVTLSGTTSNTPVTSIATNNGNVLMVAYKGSGTNSGSIVGTATAKQTTTGPSTVINAGTGSVTLIGGGAQITAQNITGGNVSILAGTPTLSADLTVTDGALTGGTYSVTGAPSATAINLTAINSSGNVTISTAGATSTTAKAPLLLDAKGLTFNGTGTTSSLYVSSTGSGALDLNPTAASTLGGTLSLTSAGNIVVDNDITGKGNIILNATGTIIGAGTLGGTSATLTATLGVGAGVLSPLNVAVNTLAVNTTGGGVAISEGVSAGKALSLLTSSTGGNASFSMISAQPLTVNGTITNTDGSVSLTGSETTTNTVNGTTTVNGITIAKAINVGAGGSITLSTTGNENIVEKSVTLTAPTITINAAGAVGTSGSPLVTETASLTLNSFSTNGVHAKDLSTGSFTVTGTAKFGGGTVSVVSLAKDFTVGALPYTNVTLTDTVVGATTTISAGAALIGDGTGIVTITTAGSLVYNLGLIGANTAVITSTAGSIGTSALPLNINAGTLTANAVKGSVFLNTAIDTTLLAGAALTTYQVTATNLDMEGTIKATDTKLGTVNLSVSGLMTQGFPNLFVQGVNVNLATTAANAGIGNGIGFQSIQTKAITALTITENGDGSTAFVTQTGNITLNTVSSGGAFTNTSLNLATAPGSKLTVGSTIDFTNVSLTVPTTLTVGTAGEINSANLTITSPIVILNNVNTAAGAGSINMASGGSTSFISATTLAITGPGVVNLGSSLSLSGALGITLGNASGTLAGQNNPLAKIGDVGAGGLSNLTIFTTGIFTGNYNEFVLNTGAADSISLTAVSLKDTGTFTGAPFMLSALGTASSGTNANSVTLALTGSANLTLGSVTVAKNKPLEYDISIGGTNGGAVSVLTGGILSIDTSLPDMGLNINPAANNNISFTGRSLPLTVLPSNYFSSGKFDAVSLVATSGTFTVGATTSTAIKNGISGGITADVVNLSALSGLTINAGQTIQGAQLSLNSSVIQMDGTITGVGSKAVPNPTLSLSNFNEASLTIKPDTTGTYTGITSVVIQATTGGINLGSLFTSNTLLGNGTLDSIAISAAAGGVTIPTTLSTLSVSNGGVLYLVAGSLSYSPSNKNPQSYLSMDAPNGAITLQTGGAIVLGKTHGSIDLEAGSNGAYTVTTKGALTVNEPLSTASGSLNGAAITLNDAVSATGTLQVLADISRSSNIKSNGFELTANTLIVGVGNPFISSNSTINIDTPNILLVNGGLKLNNTFAGDVNVSEQFGGQTQVYAVTLTNSSGLPTSTLTIGSISTTFGNLNIVNTNGNMVVANGAQLTTLFGNIYIQNNDLTNGTIVVQPNVFMHGSGVITDLGQIYITMGAAPIVFFSLKGPVPGPDVPLTSSTGGAEIFFTTTSNPLNTITSIGLNTLNASGRNVVFNGAGNNNAITLEGNDVITADPPPVTPVVSSAGQNTAALLSLASNNSAITSAFSPALVAAAAQTSGGQNQISTSSLTGQNPTLNWSLPTTLAISGAQQSGEFDGPRLALPGGISSGNLNNNVFGTTGSGNIGPQYPTEYSIQSGIRSDDQAGKQSTSRKLLTGGISNAAVKTLDRGVQMLAPKEKTTLVTAYGSVDVAAGAVAMVMAFDGGLAVYNLHDTRSGAVLVRAGDQAISLAPGQNAIFTDKNIRSFEEINPAQRVAYRAVTAKQWGKGLTGFRSEFSIVSMMQSVDAFRQLMRAKDSDARVTINMVVKTGAILSQLGGEQYQIMAPQKVAALIGNR